MPSTSRDPATGATNGLQLPITRAFAMTVLAALLLLVLFRFVFGSVRVEVGTK